MDLSNLVVVVMEDIREKYTELGRWDFGMHPQRGI
jgi:hypothetical protein